MSRSTINIPTPEFPFSYQVVRGLKVITKRTLEAICPEALRAPAGPEDEELDEVIWVMTDKPVMESGWPPYSEEEGGDEDDEDDEDHREESWSETNEPELAEAIAEGWHALAVNVGGVMVVILAGTWDDEYGWYWDNTHKRWESYSY